MKPSGRSRRNKGRHTQTRREPPRHTKPKPKQIKMADKKDADKELFKKEETEGQEPGQDAPLPVKIVAGDEPKVPARRSDTEQSIIDSYGNDPSKHKEGSRERELVESLPENIAKKREQEEKEKQEAEKEGGTKKGK